MLEVASVVEAADRGQIRNGNVVRRVRLLQGQQAPSVELDRRVGGAGPFDP